MDFISILGLIVGLAAIVGGQVLEGGHVKSLLQPTAFLIVAGGTLGAVMVQTPFAKFRRGIGMIAWIFSPPKVDQLRVIEELKHWSNISRREGLLALESYVEQLKDPFAKKGLQMLVDGADPQNLRAVLETDIGTYEEELRQSAKIWESAGGYLPTVGIIGAVMGLIHVMENLSDPSKLGSGIAVAFVATIYGVGLANLVCLPFAGKLKSLIAQQVQMREMLVDGLASIAVGENPTILEGRLQSYVSLDSRPSI